jgi:hypothetical protein
MPEPVTLGGQHTETAALRNVLARAGAIAPHTGQPWSEPMLLGLGGGLGGGYIVLEYAGAPTALVVAFQNMWQYPHEFLGAALARVGATFDTLLTGSPKVAERHLRQALGAGQPAVAWVIRGELPHRQVAPAFEQFFLHQVTVWAIDGDDAFVDDLAPALWRVPLEELARARAAIRSDKHRLLIVTGTSGPVDLEAAVVESIRDCWRALLHPPSGNFGLAALAKWRDLVANRRDAKGWPRLFQPLPRLWQGLATTHATIEALGTGGSALRGMYAEFLAEAGAALGRNDLVRVSAAYAEVAAKWTALANAALPDDVAVLARGRELLTERQRLWRTEGPRAAEQILAIAEQIRELERRIEAAFPLDEAAALALLDGLRERLAEIHQAELAAAAMLREIAPGDAPAREGSRRWQ